MIENANSVFAHSLTSNTSQNGASSPLSAEQRVCDGIRRQDSNKVDNTMSRNFERWFLNQWRKDLKNRSRCFKKEFGK